MKSINFARYSKNSGGAAALSDQQELGDSSNMTLPTGSSLSLNRNKVDADASRSDDIKEHDILDSVDITNTDDNTAMEDNERKESGSLSLSDGGGSEPEDPSSLQKGTDLNAEESLALNGSTSSEVPLEEVDVAGETIADLKEHESNGGGDQILAEITTASFSVANEGKSVDGASDLLDHNHEAFEPGCVFVEFLRKEAACAAAHCLHHRSYGENIVSASYISYDLYKAQFPR